MKKNKEQKKKFKKIIEEFENDEIYFDEFEQKKIKNRDRYNNKKRYKEKYHQDKWR